MSRRQWLVLGCALLLLGMVKLALVSWYLLKTPQTPLPVTVACGYQSGACALPGGVRLRFLEPLSESHAFSIALEGVGQGEPSAEFSMRSMDMGFNRYRFVRVNGRWEARVTLPGCVSGRHDWMMTLNLNGQRIQVPLNID